MLTIKEQCSLIELNLSSYYYQPLGITEEGLELMAKIDRIYTKTPFYGIREITEELRRHGDIYNHKRIGRLMHLIGIQAVTPKRNLSKPNKDHLVYPHLLRDVQITATNQVWSTNITYLPIYKGYAYLVAVIDWFSKFVLSWELSTGLDVYFCLEALDRALRQGLQDYFYFYNY